MLRDHRSQKLLLVGGILLLAFSHWFIGGPDKHLNNLLYNLNFVPILVGGMLLGWRTAVFATVLTLAAEMPHLWLFWPNDETYRMDQIFETLSLPESAALQSVFWQARSGGTGPNWKKPRGNWRSESGTARQPGASR